ncbi:MAG TPA: phosphate signaling complex protein PhoU [Actinophytocola sp.]|jgi:phosphate transport system protein|nr:phosphate signaling complex protein PhoU [Actinophytocola sp.]
MREDFHTQLIGLREQLGGMCDLAVTALRSASTAVLEGDVNLARQVLAADAALDRARDRCEETTQQLLALQAPVARDLRLVLTALYCTTKLERMGDLAAHVADAARLAYPDRLVPADMEDAFTDLGRIAAGMAARLAELVRDPGRCCYAELEETDRAVDAVHADVMRVITGKNWAHGVPTATSLALLARYYERFADQAVSVARRLDFAVTGETPVA